MIYAVIMSFVVTFAAIAPFSCSLASCERSLAIFKEKASSALLAQRDTLETRSIALAIPLESTRDSVISEKFRRLHAELTKIEGLEIGNFEVLRAVSSTRPDDFRIPKEGAIAFLVLYVQGSADALLEAISQPSVLSAELSAVSTGRPYEFIVADPEL
jgi:hypothetical protein